MNQLSKAALICRIRLISLPCDKIFVMVQTSFCSLVQISFASATALKSRCVWFHVSIKKEFYQQISLFFQGFSLFSAKKRPWGISSSRSNSYFVIAKSFLHQTGKWTLLRHNFLILLSLCDSCLFRLSPLIGH